VLDKAKAKYNIKYKVNIVVTIKNALGAFVLKGYWQPQPRINLNNSSIYASTGRPQTVAIP